MFFYDFDTKRLRTAERKYGYKLVLAQSHSYIN